MATKVDDVKRSKSKSSVKAYLEGLCNFKKLNQN